MKKTILIFLSIGLVFLSLSVANGAKPAPDNVKTETNVLAALPAQDIFGQPLTLNSRLYVLDVWATWCPPCRMTVPELIGLQNDFKDKGLTVIGLSVDLKDSVVLDFAMQYGINYPVAMAGDSLRALPPVRGIPTMFFVDSRGKILKTHIGYTDKKELAEEVKKFLK